MCQNIVHIPPCFLQVHGAFLHLCFGRHFLGPPAHAVDAVQEVKVGGVAFCAHLLDVKKPGVAGFEDPVTDVVAPDTAEGEEGFPVDAENLPPHEVQDGRPDLVHLSAVPLADRERVKPVKVLMVSVYEQRRKILLFQPVQPVILFAVLRIGAPDPAEIAEDDDVILLRHFFLFGESSCFESPEICVRITCDIDHVWPP